MNSSGSAMAENAKWMDSIEGKSQQLTNSMQAMWNSTLNSEVIKYFLAVANNIIKVVDSVGLLTTALAGVATYFFVIKRNSPTVLWQEMVAHINNYAMAAKQVSALKSLNINIGTPGTSSFDATAVNQYAAAVNSLSAKQQAAILSTQGLNAEQIKAVLVANQASDADIKAALSKNGLTQATAANSVATGALLLMKAKEKSITLSEEAQNYLLAHSVETITKKKLAHAVVAGKISHQTAAEIVQSGILTTTNMKQAFSWKALGTAMKTAFLSNPVGWIMTIISAVTMLSPVFEDLFKSTEEKIQDLESKWKELSDKITTASNDFKTLKSSADEVIPRFAELSEGVDRFGNNMKLTDAEYKEFLSLNNQIAEMFPEINNGMDSNGNAMLALSLSAETLEQSLWDLVEAERAAANEEIAKTMPDVLTNIKETVNAYGDSASEITDSKKQIEEAYEVFSSGDPYQFSSSVGTSTNQILKSLDKLGIDYDVEAIAERNGIVGSTTYEVTFNTDIETARRNYENAIAGLDIEIQNINDKIANKWAQLNPVVAAWTQTDYTFQGLSDEMQTVVQSMIGNIDFSSLGKDTQEEVQNYIKNNILNKIDALGPVAQQKFSKLMSLDASNISTEEYIAEINSVAKEIENLNEGWTADEVLKNTGYKDVIQDYDDTVDKIVDIFRKGSESSRKITQDSEVKLAVPAADLPDEANLENFLTKPNSLFVKENAESIGQVSEEVDNLQDSIDSVKLKEIFFNNIPKATKQSVDGLKETSEEVDNLKSKLYSLKPDELTKAFDYVKKYGIKTWDDLYKALQNKTFDVVLDYDAENEGIEKLRAAIDESVSATGLSSESIANLKARYQDLEGYDPARLFEETTNGIHLNTEALRELEQEYRKQTKTDLDNKLDGLVEQYNNLTTEIEGCTDASERANLYAQRQNILDQINDTATLAARYEGLTSAYNRWQQAQSGANERDMYEGIISGKKELEEELARGWLDEGSRTYLELLSGQDLSTAAYDKVLETYKKINETINGAGYNVFDFFTTDDDGNSTTAGIYNFLDTVKVAQEKLGKEWVKTGEDGSYVFDFGIDGDKAVAEALGISEELVQIILRAASDAGFEVNLDSTYSELADFKDEVEVVNDRLKEIKATEYTFNINSTDINDVEKQIEEAKTAIKNLENEDGTIKVGINQEDYENAKTLLATLIYQKQTLDESAVLKVDTTNADAGIETVIQKLVQFKTDYNNLEVKTAVGADTTEAEANVKAAIESLQQEDPKILADLGIDLTKSNADINTAISNITPELMVKCGLDATLIEGYQEAEHTTDGEVIWNNNIDAVTEWMNQTHETDGTVVWDDDTTKVKTHFSASGTINWSGAQKADGTAHSSGNAFAGGSWGAPKTETSLVGELGPEILVRNGRWTTVGENGAEFTQVKKGDIIFNHKQTEELLSNGYVTGRGKAYSSGTAYSSGGGPGRYTITSAYIASSSSSDSSASDVADSISDASDAADDFEETLDWIEIRLEEINEQLDLMNAQLENAVGYAKKNNIIDSIIGVNETKMSNLVAGIKKYADYAAKLLSEVPSQYRAAAQDGSIAITEFTGEANEATVEAINNYREWAQKVADLKQQLEEVKTEIKELAIQKFDNIYDYGDAKTTIEDSQTDKLQNAVDYDEERGLITSAAYYKAMMENSGKKIEYWTPLRDEMQKQLDDAVKKGIITRGSNEWYEMLEQLYDVDAAIDEAAIELEEFQNAINDIYWDNLDELINRLDYLKDETQSLIDLMDSDDMIAEPEKKKYKNGTVEYWTADDVDWTDEGIASLGLYAQQMEIAEYQSKQYAKAIDDLNKDYKAGKYSEIEYLEKLNELKSAQYDSIEAYYDAQDAIKDLNETRIDSIKEGIEKEIDAYSELIDKKKEELSAEKDLYDFQKSIKESSKNIADIQRKIAALSGDTSASAVAKRKQLEAELIEAQAEQEELYYERSIENQQNALDKELEDFQAAKDAETAKWDEYLTNVETVVADSLGIIQANATGVYDTLNAKAQEYNLTLSDAIMTPWQDGALAVSDYQNTFDTAISSTMDQLEELKNKWQEVIDKMAETGRVNVTEINKENSRYTSVAPVPTKPATNQTNTTTAKTIKVGGKIDAGSAKIYDYAGGTGYKQYFRNDPVYIVLAEQNGYLKVRHHASSSGVTGWFKKSDVKAYAKGTKGVDKDQWALIDELGDELQLVPDGQGRLAYIKKGTSIVPADVTERLMNIAMNPQEMIEQNRPQIGAPHITNNEINISMDIAEVVHIDKVTNDTIPDLTKAVEKQMDAYMVKLNNSLKRFTR